MPTSSGMIFCPTARIPLVNISLLCIYLGNDGFISGDKNDLPSFPSAWTKQKTGKIVFWATVELKEQVLPLFWPLPAEINMRLCMTFLAKIKSVYVGTAFRLITLDTCFLHVLIFVEQLKHGQKFDPWSKYFNNYLDLALSNDATLFLTSLNIDRKKCRPYSCSHFYANDIW